MNGDGNFKMRCIDVGNDIYTKGKIYEVINGVWLDDEDDSVGDESVKTIDDINGRSCATWELVEEEISEPVKEEKSLLEIVMERLNIEEGEEFNIYTDCGNPSSGNPFMFEEQMLKDKDGYQCSNHLYLLIIGRYKIEKLKWKPKNGEHVWTVAPNNECVWFVFDDKYPDCVACYKMGWIFKTSEEAEANQERVLAEIREVMEDE